MLSELSFPSDEMRPGLLYGVDAQIKALNVDYYYIKISI